MLRLGMLLSALLALVTLAGCNGFSVSHRPDRGGDRDHRDEPIAMRKPGPPPHAPAHGYRAKHESGRELRYDEGLDVYVVIGETDVWFDDGWFIRVRNGAWEFSASFDGPWELRTASAVPEKLRLKKQPKVAKGKHKKQPGNGRGAVPAKGGW